MNVSRSPLLLGAINRQLDFIFEISKREKQQ
jgi:hypothetical protein